MGGVRARVLPVYTFKMMPRIDKCTFVTFRSGIRGKQGCGSRRGKFEGKNRKNARKMEENCNFIIKY